MYKTLFIWIGLLLIFSLGCKPNQELIFNSTFALEHIQDQLSFGPRIPSSEGSELAQNYIQNELEKNGWIFETQEFVFDAKKLVNVIGKSSHNPPDLLIGTHYDTREFSDQETNPENYYLPVPGANDGASGTAVLLELSRILDPQTHNIWFAFFDGEDQGFINDWTWSVGAQYFADQASEKLTKVVIVDMVADKNLNIFKEKNSNVALCDEIWITAEKIGHDDFFINEVKYAIIDDHLPFINKGIPSCLVIDLDYTHWHLQSDTLENVSVKSLDIVGNVLHTWIKSTLP